ncbi:MAG: glycoside hydrolase family 3 N-terminal domain-containing protein, partial [Pseudomonadota bacterium]
MTSFNSAALIAISLSMLSAGCKQDSTPPAEEAAAEADTTAAAAVTKENWPRAVSPVVYGDDLERRVDSLIGVMTTAEKVGQIIQADIGSVTPEDVRKYRFGSILNGGNSAPGGKQYARAEEWLALADAFYDASVEGVDDGNAIPVVWGSDAVHGHANVVGATVFPHNIGLGATHNPGLMRDIGRVTATEMRVTGIGWTFAPTVAVARDDRWGRTYESYSENPELVAEYARAILVGLQGEAGTAGFLRGTNVIATAKHFLADGGTANGKDQGDAQIDEEELVRIHATPYVAAIEAGVQVVMASFSSWR